MRKELKYGFLGLIAGVLNGLFGAGGGLLVVPLLEAQKLPPQKAHATSIAIILPLSLISALLYLGKGVDPHWQQLVPLIPLGLAGAAIGAFLLTKLKNTLLKKLFGIVMIVSAIRILLRG